MVLPGSIPWFEFMSSGRLLDADAWVHSDAHRTAGRPGPQQMVPTLRNSTSLTSRPFVAQTFLSDIPVGRL
jgi:hypothetical protein